MPTTISIDASVAVKAIVEERDSDRARAIVAANDLILAPAHAYAEIAEIVFRKSLTGLHMLRKTAGTEFSSVVIGLESFISPP